VHRRYHRHQEVRVVAVHHQEVRVVAVRHQGALTVVPQPPAEDKLLIKCFLLELLSPGPISLLSLGREVFNNL
jgi:hypothetical protein